MRKQIESLRPARKSLSAWDKPRTIQSLEPVGRGGSVHCTTVFLVGAECPFRCSMCDLWMGTLFTPTPEGAIPYQLKLALESLTTEGKDSNESQPHWLKLYNASNFFDSRAVPKVDLQAIAEMCKPFERVIVENHPRFCDERMDWFADHLDGQLEVAMGLETIHPQAMALMNKEMALEDFDLSMDYCKRRGIDTRAFVLLKPPGVPADESIDWTWRTINYAFDRGARHVSVIPVRSGNGWVDQQINEGNYKLPTIKLIRDFFRDGAKSLKSPPFLRTSTSLPLSSLSGRLSQRESDVTLPPGRSSEARGGFALTFQPPRISEELPVSGTNEQTQATHQPVDSVLEFDLWDWNSIAGGCTVCRTWLYQLILHFNATSLVLPIERKLIDCECDL